MCTGGFVSAQLQEKRIERGEGKKSCALGGFVSAQLLYGGNEIVCGACRSACMFCFLLFEKVHSCTQTLLQPTVCTV